jgi:hypothetical protein
VPALTADLPDSVVAEILDDRCLIGEHDDLSITNTSIAKAVLFVQ